MSMTSADDAGEWHLAVSHLVQAHGADRNLIISRSLTLEQVAFIHLDSHTALEYASLHPPDRHTHPAPLPPGWHEPRPGSYRPFLPSPAAQDDLEFAEHFLLPEHLGLPLTGEHPGVGAQAADAEAELNDWASAVNRRILARQQAHHGPPGEENWLVSRKCRLIRRHAASASARWRAAQGALSGAADLGAGLSPGRELAAGKDTEAAGPAGVAQLGPTGMNFPLSAAGPAQRRGTPRSNPGRPGQSPARRSPRGAI